MLRLQVREIAGWLSGGSQDSGTPAMDSYTQNNFWLDSRIDPEGAVDTVEPVPGDEPLTDARKSQRTPSH